MNRAGSRSLHPYDCRERRLARRQAQSAERRSAPVRSQFSVVRHPIAASESAAPCAASQPTPGFSRHAACAPCDRHRNKPAEGPRSRLHCGVPADCTIGRRIRCCGRAARPPVLRHICHVRPFQIDRTLCGQIQQSDHVHQRRFSGAGWSHHGESFTALYIETDIADRRHGKTVSPVRSIHGAQPEKWSCHGPNLIPSNFMPAGRIACPTATSLPSTTSPSLSATCSAPAAPTLTGTRRSAPLEVRTHKPEGSGSWASFVPCGWKRKAASGTFRTSSWCSMTILTRAVMPGSRAPSRLEVARTTV